MGDFSSCSVCMLMAISMVFLGKVSEAASTVKLKCLSEGEEGNGVKNLLEGILALLTVLGKLLLILVDCSYPCL